MKKATMKMDHLDFLSLPWRLCRNLQVEKSTSGKRENFAVLEKTCRIQDNRFGQCWGHRFLTRQFKMGCKGV